MVRRKLKQWHYISTLIVIIIFVTSGYSAANPVITTSTIDNGGDKDFNFYDTGSNGDISIDDGDTLHVIYLDAENDTVKYARKAPTETKWDISVVDDINAETDIGSFVNDVDYFFNSSITVDTDGNLHILYMYEIDEQEYNTKVKYGYYDGTWHLQEIDKLDESTGDYGTKIMIRPNGEIHMLYGSRNLHHGIIDGTTLSVQNNIHFLREGWDACIKNDIIYYVDGYWLFARLHIGIYTEEAWIWSQVDLNTAITEPSIDIDSSGNIHVVGHNYLKHVEIHPDLSFDQINIDPAWGAGVYSDIVNNDDDILQILYTYKPMGGLTELCFSYWDPAANTSWMKIVESEGTFRALAVVLDSNQNVQGIYYDKTRGDLKHILVNYSGIHDWQVTTTTQGKGTINLDPAGGTYDDGTSVTMTAIPSDGYQFDYWEGDASTTTNPLTITIDGDIQVSAVFVKEEDDDDDDGGGGGGGCFISNLF